MNALRRLLLGCWSRHDYLRTRTPDRAAILRCQTCGDEQPMFQSVIVKGPAHAQAADLGARTTKARRVLRDNVHEFQKSER